MPFNLFQFYYIFFFFFVQKMQLISCRNKSEMEMDFEGNHLAEIPFSTLSVTNLSWRAFRLALLVFCPHQALPSLVVFWPSFYPLMLEYNFYFICPINHTNKRAYRSVFFKQSALPEVSQNLGGFSFFSEKRSGLLFPWYRIRRIFAAQIIRRLSEIGLLWPCPVKLFIIEK